MSEPYFWAAREAWYINYWADGKRQKKCLGKTKAEANRRYRDWLQEGQQLRRGQVRFGRLAGEWLSRQTTRCSRGEVSKGWLARATRTIEKFTAVHPNKLAEVITPTVDTVWLPKDSSTDQTLTASRTSGATAPIMFRAVEMLPLRRNFEQIDDLPPKQ